MFRHLSQLCIYVRHIIGLHWLERRIKFKFYNSQLPANFIFCLLNEYISRLVSYIKKKKFYIQCDSLKIQPFLTSLKKGQKSPKK